MAQSRKPHAPVGIGDAEKERTAEAAKIARLRALRLAKEAEDRAAAATSALVATAAPRRSSSARSIRGNGPAGRRAADRG